MKKLLSLVLALTILLGALAVFPLGAGAQEDEPSPALILPQIRVTTADGGGLALQKADGYVGAEITVTDTDGTSFTESVQFKVRGNTTAMASVRKKAFTFKFSKKKNVLGMGSGKKWALLANAFDPTQLRNYIALELARHLGLAYTSEQRFAELWLDGSYRGLYLLTEPVQEGKDRVNIDIDSNGGKKDFLLEYERLLNEDDVTYLKIGSLRFAVKEPEEPTEEQFAYIRSITEDIVSTIQTGTQEEIESKIDVDSFARYFLLNEFLKTYDFDTSSVFYYYQDGKLHAGPPWDYDLSSGNTTDQQKRGRAAHEPEGVFADKQLFSYLYKYEWFRDEVRRVFIENSAYLKDISAPDGMIDALFAAYGEYFLRNFADKGLCPKNGFINIQQKPFATYEENLDYLRDWLSRRYAWLAGIYDTYLCGDADGDETITVLDSTRIQRLLAELIDDPDGRIALRGNIRGEDLDILDATLIQRWLLELEPELPIGEYFAYPQSA